MIGFLLLTGGGTNVNNPKKGGEGMTAGGGKEGAGGIRDKYECNFTTSR